MHIFSKNFRLGDSTLNMTYASFLTAFQSLDLNFNMKLFFSLTLAH